MKHCNLSSRMESCPGPSKHSAFLFYMRAFQVKDLLWNNDSTVLAVWLEDLTAAEDKPVHTYSEPDQPNNVNIVSAFIYTHSV